MKSRDELQRIALLQEFKTHMQTKMLDAEVAADFGRYEEAYRILKHLLKEKKDVYAMPFIMTSEDLEIDCLDHKCRFIAEDYLKAYQKANQRAKANEEKSETKSLKAELAEVKEELAQIKEMMKTSQAAVSVVKFGVFNASGKGDRDNEAKASSGLGFGNSGGSN